MNDFVDAPGSIGDAIDANSAAEDAGLGQVIVGEIPDADDLTHMLWTARCTIPAHGLLGTFEDQAKAENARRQHLLTEHGGQLRG
jgi:hypothetical protein